MRPLLAEGSLYLKRIYKVQYEDELKVVAYTDSDWAGDLRSRRSTSGAVVKLGEHVAQVKAACQKVVALSSMESEFYAMCRAGTLAVYIENVVKFWEHELLMTVLRADSSSAKALAERRGVVAKQGMSKPACYGFRTKSSQRSWPWRKWPEP